jgi:hypothetical protein
MAEAGTPLPARSAKVLPQMFTAGDIRKLSIKDYGHTYFLEEIAWPIGLKDLSEALPETWREIWTLTTYLIYSEGHPGSRQTRPG